jgi:cell wall-associated NlpC family hydrolase
VLPSSAGQLRNRARRALGGLVGALLAGSLVTAPPSVADSGRAGAPAAERLSVAERAGKALGVARRQIGDSYRYGAEGPDRFDCSGLVWFATHRAGFSSVPRTSSEQAEHMRRIERSKLRKGDFVFFRNKRGVYHVGFFVGRHDGDRMILHAPGSGKDVRRDPIWTDKWFAGTLRGA